MRIKHNLSAMNLNNFLGITTNEDKKVTEKLSSGYRINRAADDAAGLAISEKMRAQIRGLTQGSRNAEDGISLVQTADGALNEVHAMLQRMNKLSVQASNGICSDDDRSLIQKEINQLVKQVDGISSQTEFNGISLLDGTLKEQSSSSLESLKVNQKNNSMPLKELLNSNSKNQNIIYIENTDDYATTQTEVGNTTISGYNSLKNILQNEMVPESVKSIVNAYAPAFDYLSSSSIGIGLNLYSDPSSTTLASVTIGYSYHNDGSVVDNMMTYNLSVNMSGLDFTDSSGNLTTNSRNALEATVAHEMVHAFMDEAVTNGMTGVSNGYINSAENFPKWFKEGMAQTAAGGYNNNNDWVKNGLGIDDSSSAGDILSAVSSNNLASESTHACYGTGYLAGMYLGYLASGGSSISSTSIGAGLGIIMDKLHSGSSLDSVINEVSGGKYTSTADFEQKFGDSTSCTFIHNLSSIVGNAGNGSVIAGNLADNDVLSDAPATTSLFKLDISNDIVKNVYPSGVTAFEGGTTTKSANGTTTPTGGGTTPPTPTPNPGGSSSGNLGGVKIQIGAEGNQTITISIDSAKASDLGIGNLSVLNQGDAEKAIHLCTNAIDRVSKIRGTLGAFQNRLEHAIASVDITSENLQDAESRIRDMDMAKGIMEHIKYKVLMNSGISMLSQANQTTESMLALMG